MNNILNKNINVLGIKTTCDEPAAAIVSLNEKVKVIYFLICS